MIRFLLSVLLIFSNICGYSQTKSIDSLQGTLLHQKPDTNKVYKFIQLATLLATEKEYSKALQYAQQGLKLGEKLHFKKGVADANKSIGGIFSAEEHFVEMLDPYYHALQLYTVLKDRRNIALCLARIGFSHQMQFDFEEALRNMEQSLSIWKELGDAVEIARLNNIIGTVYIVTGRPKEALEKHLSALEIARRQNSAFWLLAMTLPRVGGDYEALAERASKSGNETEAEHLYAVALQNYKEALEIDEKISSKGFIAEVYWHFGTIYVKLKKYDLAKEYFQKSLALSKSINHSLTVLLSYEYLSKIDSIQGNYQKALESYHTFFLYRDSLHNSESARKTKQAQLQYEFNKKEDSLNLQQQLTNEKLKQQQLLSIQQQQQLQLQQASLSISNQQKKLNELAFLRTQTELQVEQNARRDNEKQLLILEKERALQQANLKLKTTQLDLKEKEISAKKMERNVFVGSAFAILLVGFTLYRTSRHKQKLSSLLEKQQMRTQIASDLHDNIGSELTSISFYSEMVKMQLPGDNAPAKNTLEKIGNNARTIVNTMNDIVWVINPENDITENLIRRIQNHVSELCNERDINYRFDTECETADLSLNMQQRKNLYLIFKEALHNAIKYSGCSKINIKLCQKDHLVQLMIQDNGRGFDPANAREGNGLRNMKKRAEEIKAILDLKACPSRGTSILLELKIT